MFLVGKGGQSHILRGSKGVGVTIESYGKVEISYIKKERRKRRRRIIIIKIKIIIRNGAKTISLPNLFGRLNYERICLNKSKFCLIFGGF
jgi:hypothetical protein